MMDDITIKCGRPRKGDELLSRERILDAAFTLFIEHGYGDLCLEMVAKTAHVSMRTIYNEFDGKAGLFGAVIRRCSDPYVQALEDSKLLEMPPEEALLSFARNFLYGITRPEMIKIRILLIGESSRFPHIIEQFYQQGPERTLQHLTQFFLTHQNKGCFPRFEASVLADQFLSCLRSERFQRLLMYQETLPNKEEIDTWVEQAVSLFLYGSLLPNEHKLTSSPT
jgi:AcrR family transcriptional regulator